jgi:PAS domain S-box-containing protein
MRDSHGIQNPHKKHTRFQARFLFVIATILIVFSSLVAIIIYRHEMDTLEANAYEKTDLVMKAIEANRDYVQEILRPTMYKELPNHKFILEAMSSSYISRMVMERFNQKAQGFIYRRVAVNARNPDYEANPLETQMIARFRSNPALEGWQGIIELESKKYYMRFQPVTFKSSCLNCHGDPNDAPQEVVALYGRSNGFFHKINEPAGVISVGVPIGLSLGKINSFTLALLAGVLPSILIMYLIISTFFNRFITGNLRNILSFFRTTITDDKGKSIFDSSEKIDEIEALTSTAKAIAEHLHSNQHQLEKYAAEVKGSKDLLQSVFDGISDPVILIDSESRMKMVNAAFLKRYQLTMEQVLDQKPAELLSAACCPLAACSDLFGALPDHPVSREVLVASGEIFLIYFYPIQTQSGATESMVCYVKDITEQKKLEIKIQQTEKIASIGQMAAGIAHEINNPLGVILCHIDLIKGESNLTPEAQSDLDIIEKHVGTCRTIISDLLKFAHQHASTKEPVSLNTLIDEVVAMVSSQCKKQRITLEKHLAPDLPLVTVDADKIKQVLLNMLINSAQAMVEDGTVSIASRFDTARQSVQIVLEDTGPGIAPGIVDKIFDPFFTTKPPGKGTGLGLSVSYGIIREHDGDITVESLPGQLTRFVIGLPAAGEAP